MLKINTKKIKWFFAGLTVLVLGGAYLFGQAAFNDLEIPTGQRMGEVLSTNTFFDTEHRALRSTPLSQFLRIKGER